MGVVGFWDSWNSVFVNLSTILKSKFTFACIVRVDAPVAQLQSIRSITAHFYCLSPFKLSNEKALEGINWISGS